MNTAAVSGGAEDKYGKIILMNNQDRLFQAGHYIEEEKAVKRYRIKISRRVSNQSERDQFSFGMIGDGKSKATAGERLESLIAEQDEIAVTFENLVNRNGFALDFNRHGGWGKICCIATAFTGYLRAGDELFEKALLVLWLAWEGHPDSLRHEVLDSVLRFLEIYDGEIDLDRLVTQLCLVDPIRIWENGRKAGNRFSGYRRYLFQIYQQYIGRDPKYYLPRKF